MKHALFKRNETRHDLEIEVVYFVLILLSLFYFIRAYIAMKQNNKNKIFTSSLIM